MSDSWTHLTWLFKIAPVWAALFRTGHHSTSLRSELLAVGGTLQWDLAGAGRFACLTIVRGGQRLLVGPSACVPVPNAVVGSASCSTARMDVLMLPPPLARQRGPSQVLARA
jgi:hypothetical protein